MALEHKVDVVNAVHDRIAFCWAHMGAQLKPPKYLLGDCVTVLDLYVTVVSRFGPGRARFYQAAPKMAQVVCRLDSEPKLKQFWDRRYPFDADAT